MKGKVAIIGAGGKMGTRITNNLIKSADYAVSYCEKSETGIGRLKEKGLAVRPASEAVPEADFVVMAVPDALLSSVSADTVALLKPGATVILLDPAAPTAGEVVVRNGVTFVVCHPCHPPLFGQQDSDEARKDFFGGVVAKQDIVIALMKGGEKDFAKAEELCKTMFAPVVKAYRITVEQMAILEPAMAEVVAATAAVLMKEALEMAVVKGVPREAAISFMMGHAQIPLAIVFGAIGSPFSDAAKIAIEYGKRHIVRKDWKKVFEQKNVRACIREMLHSGKTK
jgi:hypothetical protein